MSAAVAWLRLMRARVWREEMAAGLSGDGG